MPQAFTIPIVDVVRILGLEVNPKDNIGASSFNVRCPFCDKAGTRKYHMNINTVKNVYFCPRCMDSTMGNSGALDLYGRVRLGTPLTPGVNGKQLYHALCCELENKQPNFKPGTDTKVSYSEILPANDEKLNAAYVALLELPYLALSMKHGKNLIKRGLDRDAIELGKYASLREAMLMLKTNKRTDEMTEWYDKHRIGSVKNDSSVLQYYSKSEIVAGLIIAADLTDAGIDLTNVPGFYKLCGRWAFRYDQGMLIPTVNVNGQIVGLQVRRDAATKKSGLRYMTVSSKGLDGGVTTRIARTHVAKTGAIGPETSVFITEGPLKADVIVHLLSEKCPGQSIAVIAIQGVNNTKELPNLASYLVFRGVKTAYSALDMDKTGNMAVAQAGRAIKKIFSDNGVELKPLLWDRDYAVVKYGELAKICKDHGIDVPKTKNVFMDVYTMAKSLYDKNIPYNVNIVDGKEYKDHWRDETKGLDDYLLFEKTKRESTA